MAARNGLTSWLVVPDPFDVGEWDTDRQMREGWPRGCTRRRSGPAPGFHERTRCRTSSRWKARDSLERRITARSTPRLTPDRHRDDRQLKGDDDPLENSREEEVLPTMRQSSGGAAINDVQGRGGECEDHHRGHPPPRMAERDGLDGLGPGSTTRGDGVAHGRAGVRCTAAYRRSSRNSALTRDLSTMARSWRPSAAVVVQRHRRARDADRPRRPIC